MSVLEEQGSLTTMKAGRNALSHFVAKLDALRWTDGEKSDGGERDEEKNQESVEHNEEGMQPPKPVKREGLAYKKHTRYADSHVLATTLLAEETAQSRHNQHVLL